MHNYASTFALIARHGRCRHRRRRSKHRWQRYSIQMGEATYTPRQVGMCQ